MATSRILVLEGYNAHPRKGANMAKRKRARRSGGKTANQKRFAAAAHACAKQAKGGGRKSYISCMRDKLKK